MFRCILLIWGEGRGVSPGKIPKKAPPSRKPAFSYAASGSASAVQTTSDSGVQMAM